MHTVALIAGIGLAWLVTATLLAIVLCRFLAFGCPASPEMEQHQPGDVDPEYLRAVRHLRMVEQFHVSGDSL